MITSYIQVSYNQLYNQIEQGSRQLRQSGNQLWQGSTRLRQKDSQLVVWPVAMKPLTAKQGYDEVVCVSPHCRYFYVFSRCDTVSVLHLLLKSIFLYVQRNYTVAASSGYRPAVTSYSPPVNGYLSVVTV